MLYDISFYVPATDNTAGKMTPATWSRAAGLKTCSPARERAVSGAFFICSFRVIPRAVTKIAVSFGFPTQAPASAPAELGKFIAITP
jgi:hypothetical protein